MTAEQVLVLGVLAGALFLFVTEIVPLALTGLLVVAVLGLSGVVEPDRLFAESFAGQTVVVVGSLYVVSAALIRTGVVSAVGVRIVRLGGGSENRLVLVAMLASALFSAFLNNTSVVVLMVPILLGAARTLEIPPSRLLMPISFAAILGGTMTLIGTSTNILVADLARRESRVLEPLGFFEFLPMGAAYAAVGLLYLRLAGPRLLPRRPTVSSIVGGRAFEYVSELRVPSGSPAVGAAAREAVARADDKTKLLQVVRGEEILDGATETMLQEGDVLVLRGPAAAIVALQGALKLEALPSAGEAVTPAPRGTTFAEIVVTPASELQGRTLRQVGLKRTYGVVALALQRRGAHLRHGIADVPLRVGDVILVRGAPEEVERLHGQPGFLLLTGVGERVALRDRAPLAVGILAAFVLVAAFVDVSLPLLALCAAVASVATGCLTMRRAIEEVDWGILMLLAGSLALGLALHETGLAEMAAKHVVSVTRDFGPVAVLSAVYFLTMLTTEFVSNSGAAALMLPLAVAAAGEIDVSPRPFVFAVAFGASASFATPIGYQTNAFIFGPGGYRFTDFLRIGGPLQLLLWLFATVALPVFFPF